jgi:hypothetical protein|tara:strand:- start:474 stop:701 length:228 start_codon:yes stop_codon:yes gene_type:complete
MLPVNAIGVFFHDGIFDRLDLQSEEAMRCFNATTESICSDALSGLNNGISATESKWWKEILLGATFAKALITAEL